MPARTVSKGSRPSPVAHASRWDVFRQIPVFRSVCRPSPFLFPKDATSMSIQRRSFLAAAAASAAAVSAPAVHAAAKDKPYRTALIGSGWWGMNILREALQAGQTKVVALCDVDRDRL